MLVTGGSQGIGEAVAARFAAAGDHVLTLSRRGGSDRDAALSGDVAVADDCSVAVAAVLARHGRLDVLVNSAGISGERSGLLEFDPVDAARVLTVNVLGTLHMIAAAAEALAASKGVVVNVGSICGSVANHESIAYHASKGAVGALTRSAALQLAPHGVRVVEVSPAWVATEMTRSTLRAQPEAEALGRSLHMTGELLEPTEVADAVWLLCEPAARAITGSTVAVDHGYLAFKGPNLID